MIGNLGQSPVTEHHDANTEFNHPSCIPCAFGCPELLPEGLLLHMFLFYLHLTEAGQPHVMMAEIELQMLKTYICLLDISLHLLSWKGKVEGMMCIEDHLTGALPKYWSADPVPFLCWRRHFQYNILLIAWVILGTKECYWHGICSMENPQFSGICHKEVNRFVFLLLHLGHLLFWDWQDNYNA